ncbi:Retrovirus-related Pol polyprotein from transposon 17.6 [Phytophthora citrophthora]|uniref:RNA-directed DNA polymerase n=1 Tax=Phytophthora citrophthora TaxID=4793 RepID=A0AAD9G268_9STRA|nr:Retrovirus-related Pol polyprotein from transposon 17.6 [Phytophthora citrophthora]
MRRFQRISDLENALQQDEDVWRTGDQEMTTTKPQDFRSDNIPRGQFKPKRMNRTYVVRDWDSEDSDDEDSENHKGSLKSDQDTRDQTGDIRLPNVTSESTRDENTAQTSSSTSTVPPSADWTPTLTNEEGWTTWDGVHRPSPRQDRQKRHENGGYWNKFCEKCQRSGHSEEDCWRDIMYDRCQERGHPSRMCRVPPCEVCGKVHPGTPCEDLKTLEALKQLARQGALKDMPNHLREKLLGDEADSGKPLTNVPVGWGSETLWASQYPRVMCSRPKLRRIQDKHQQYMTTLTQGSAVPPRNSGSRLPEISEDTDPIPNDTVSFRLKGGECYGWWEDNYPDRSKRDVVMVHGAVNDRRTKILLDTGATINILSYDVARKLGLKLKSHKQTKVSGMGGVPTYIGASAEIKLTLGPRVVCIVDVWVANIGEGIDALLGMGFMFAAGLRISAREGLVLLPDEVVVMMCNWEPGDYIGRNESVRPSEAVLLSPGEEVVVRIDYGPTNPQREVVWAGRGDHWVTQLIYAARSWPVAVRVVNISDKNTWVNELSDVARIVEYGFFPRHGRFVRPGSAAYRDWGVLILESTPSPETRKRMEREAKLKALMPQSPCVDRPDYTWPTEILQRPRFDNARVQFVKSDLTPAAKREVADSLDASVDTRDLEVFSRSVSHSNSGGSSVNSGDDSPDSESESPTKDFQTPQLPAADLDLMDESWDIPIQGMPGTPVGKLRMEYERCMRVSSEELDLEPGVYMREGTDLLAQLRDQLVMLPELEELTPECDIDSADVGEPGKTTPEMEKKLRDILKHHRKIFLGDGNAAPALARGVRNIPAPTCMGPVLGRSLYIDDIAHGAPTWDQLCEDLNALLFRLRYWNISVKSEFGKLPIPYLSHEISAEGLRATPKIVKGVEELPFPSTLKGVQSFMGSLNYYNKFIEDLPVIAATLYELTDEQIRAGRELACAKEALKILKRKIVSTPLFRHPDRTRAFVIIPHANPWAASAFLGQGYDGVIHPVRFTGRVLNDAELRYHIAEKEVIAILRVLENFRALVESSPVIVVYTRYSVLKWLLTSNSTDGRNVKWGLKLSHWDLEIRRIQRDEDGLPAILGAGITPREHLDEVCNGST